MQQNAADRKSIRAAEKSARRDERERFDEIIKIASTTSGRKYLWEELEASQVFNSVFAPDPLQMAFNEGRRNQGLRLLNDIMQACPDSFIQMMVEANVRRTGGSPASTDDTESGPDADTDPSASAD